MGCINSILSELSEPRSSVKLPHGHLKYRHALSKKKRRDDHLFGTKSASVLLISSHRAYTHTGTISGGRKVLTSVSPPQKPGGYNPVTLIWMNTSHQDGA